MRTAYLLVSHGSSDARHQAGLSRLADRMQQQLARLRKDEYRLATGSSLQNYLNSNNTLVGFAEVNSSFAEPFPIRSLGLSQVDVAEVPIVGTATLEANVTPLSEQIRIFAQSVETRGIRQIVVVPLFLLAGVHVREDLPREIAAACALLPARVRLICTPYLGSHNGFKRYVAHRLAKTDAERCVLLAHGSRRSAGNRAIQQLGTILDTDVAFWTVAPNLETQIFDLVQRGYQRLAIAPYFLFPGSITDAITRQTEAVAERLPQLSLRLLAPLGTDMDLGRAVAELALTAPRGLPNVNWSQSSLLIAEKGITA
ncbi:sirohydrochlorin chelatase [Oscillatoria sp. CS-180]|uniref:sirohydrochlorin chelatase n=1 Tax=Oscillatoria sp. CS-180 TaxID=3021720 RepID=UPI00232F58DE|nr:sirohydrochlorin chelatase [Oscillatoria sp. CS-180]MDB9525783.1 sirohydrochlorin chelatase [Oscillatoria sp. CS-180]